MEIPEWLGYHAVSTVWRFVQAERHNKLLYQYRGLHSCAILTCVLNINVTRAILHNLIPLSPFLWHLPGDTGSASPRKFSSSICFGREPLGINGTGVTGRMPILSPNQQWWSTEEAQNFNYHCNFLITLHFNNTYIGNKLQRSSAMHRGFLNCLMSHSFTVSSPTHI